MKPPMHRSTVRRVWDLNSRTRHLELELAAGERFDFHPGQFIALHLNSNGQTAVRAYSIAAATRTDNCFELCLSVPPEDKAWFLGLKAGDTVPFTGPYGAFKLRHPPDRVSAFIASGTGIAPIRAMLQELYQKGHNAESWLIFGARRETDILFREEFENLARKHPGFHFVPTLSRPDPGWTGHTGYVQKHIKKYLVGREGFHAYVCGRPEMIEDVLRVLLSLGYGPEAVSLERFE
ncbi:MAG: ferredoxin--NADP reductase [Terriglobia bacterium]